MKPWTIIDQTPGEGGDPKTITDRMEVPGGYIVRTRVHGVGPHKMEAANVAMVFIPATDTSIYDVPPGDTAHPHLAS